MHSNRAFGVVVVLLALAAVAVWQFGFGRETSAPPVGVTATAPGAKPQHASVRQPGPDAAAVAARGDGSGERVAVAASKDRDDREFDLLGQVVGPEGRPIAGARVISAPGLGFANATGQIDFTSFDPSDLEDLDAATALDDVGKQLEERVEVTTDEQGRFRLRPPGATSGVGLRVLARGHAILDRRVGRPADSDVDVGILTLARGAVVAGRVLDGQGDPVAGARVGRVPEAEERMLGNMELDVPAASGIEQHREGESCVTDSAGRFELAHITAGEFLLRARHADHPTARSARLLAEAGRELRDVVVTMQGGAQIRGRVLGMPEHGKELRVVAAARPKAENGPGGIMGFFGEDMSELLAAAVMAVGERFAEVGPDGAFVLRGLGAGSYRIWVAHAGKGIAGSGICSEQLEVASGASGVELRYEAGVSVSFTVVDAGSGAPVERLWVRDRLIGGDRRLAEMIVDDNEATARARSYPGGKVTVANLRPKPKQTLTVAIEATGYGRVERSDIALPGTGTVDLGTIRLEPKPVLHVTVVAVDTGTAIADATVRLESATRRDAHPMGRRWARMGRGGSGPEAGKTDFEGRCTLNAFVSAVGVIEVDCLRYAPFVSEEISFPETGVSRFTARLHVGGQVAVTVHGPDGKPVKDAIVEHRAPVGDFAQRKTSANGIARFQRLAPGAHAFRLGKNDGPMGLVFGQMRQGGAAAAEIPWQTVDVVDRAEATLLLTKLPSALLRGVVRENGLPLAGARVAFVEGLGTDESRDVAGSVMGAMLGGGSRNAKSGEDGTYKLSELPEGEHRLHVTHRDRAMRTVVVVRLQNGDNLHDIELETTTLRGFVLDPKGNPVDGARVKARRAPKAGDVAGDFGQLMAGMLPGLANADGNNTVKTDATGVFELRGVDGDVELQVQASAKGFAATVATATVTRGKTREGVELRLGAAGRIQVSVPGAENTPFASVRASFVDESAGVTPVVQVLLKGKCTLEGLRPGAWRVEYDSNAGSGALARTVEVVAGETATVDF
ncbi:MAG TPA: carboxypeptidase regulatory-like domain-containing protein [Planctomycetota bacterium]|nr:carboxypeptidase regulatory-like domain-containing protein [Planctomycetota bacterium]